MPSPAMSFSRRGSRSVWSPKITRPCSGLARPEITSSSVVLPAPLGPITTRSSRESHHARGGAGEGADEAVGEKEHDAHEEPTEEEQPQIRIARREPRLHPVHAKGTEGGTHERPAASCGHPDNHFDRGQHAEL